MTSAGTCCVSIEIESPITDRADASRRVCIVEWQPEWADMFERERVRLLTVFDDVPVVIEHVGSTSVPGLDAKPIIDIAIGVEHLDVVEHRIPAIEALGYAYVPDYEDQMPDRRYFRRPGAHPRTHHVHCFVLGSEEWNRHIDFRDRLRDSGELAGAYGALKRRLARELGGDREAYTEAKSSFITGALSGRPAVDAHEGASS